MDGMLLSGGAESKKPEVHSTEIFGIRCCSDLGFRGSEAKSE